MIRSRIAQEQSLTQPQPTVVENDPFPTTQERLLDVLRVVLDTVGRMPKRQSVSNARCKYR